MTFEEAMKLTSISPAIQLGLPCKQNVVVVMGATGTGKSRLSIDIATRFKGEVINSDKVQVYKGLDIITNKITEKEACGVHHHLLGMFDPELDFSDENFVSMASQAIETIVGRGKLPIIAGGTISVIQALVKDDNFRSRYVPCFLWVDVDMQVLKNFLYDRVDRMVQAGMVEEVRSMYIPNADYEKGIWRAIGVKELASYLSAERSPSADKKTRATLLEKAIKKTKIKTCKLARWQIKKIKKLIMANGWEMYRLDATEVFRKKGKEADEAWKELVARPALQIVKDFQFHIDRYQDHLAANAA